jgi:replicative DNA helicase
MVDLDVIFRSIIYIKKEDGTETISQRECIKNFKSLQQIIPYPPQEKAYKILYNFILDYIKKCDSSELSVPSYEYIKEYFEKVEGNENVIIILERIKSQQPYIGMDYKNILKRYNEEQQCLELQRILNDALKVASTGLNYKTKKGALTLKGISDAVNFISRETKKLIKKELLIKTESQIVSSEDIKEFKEQYNKAEANPLDSIGILTWLEKIDTYTGGLKTGEFMVTTAFTGHCKTTFALNMAYRALFAGWNTAFITLEMSFSEIRDRIYVLHSCNPIFKKKYPQYEHIVGKISYNNVRYGKLSKEEKEYFFKVCEDIEENSSSYGKFYIWQPEKTVTTLSDIELKFKEYQQDLQLIGKDLDFGVIDYVSLLGADEWEKTRDHNETLNNVIKNLKRLCLTFNNGKGLRILTPHQANREGYKEAKKNEGVYDLTALSNTHEIERSADLVISIFKFDSTGDNNRLKFCCLKNRRNVHFSPFDACIDFNTGFIWNYPYSIDPDKDNIIDFSKI